MQLRFRALDIEKPDSRWQSLFGEYWPAYRAWFLKEGDGARPGLGECREALEAHMPELVPVWRELARLAGGDEVAARMLSLYRPPAYIFGCSQAVWSRDEPFLIRNYDYSPKLSEGVILRSNWNGTTLMGMNDCLWGLVDGMNEHGLALSLTYGGREASGDGFGIPLILRYALERARTAEEAAEVLRKVPSHMAYNLIALDEEGRHLRIELAPDREALVSDEPVSTNHQAGPPNAEYAAQVRTVERSELLMRRLGDGAETADAFIERFSRDPLFATGYERSFGTIYTAIYRPRARRVEYIWPGFICRQGLFAFREGEALILYGDDAKLELGQQDWAWQAPAGTQAQDWQRLVPPEAGDWRKYLPGFLTE
ncbi:MAG: hypothetical protein GC160_25700 [Acidobacteria bacterium]|nr:hypothetical protein [Acidobacteriota bacterium]